jgi:hypothetical protein
MRATEMKRFGGRDVLRLAEVPDLMPRAAHHHLRPRGLSLAAQEGLPSSPGGSGWAASHRRISMCRNS